MVPACEDMLDPKPRVAPHDAELTLHPGHEEAWLIGRHHAAERAAARQGDAQQDIGPAGRDALDAERFPDEPVRACNLPARQDAFARTGNGRLPDTLAASREDGAQPASLH